jgi:hypothetical protein
MGIEVCAPLAHTHHVSNEILPTIKGVKASMNIIPGTKNTFCRARSVPLALQDNVKKELERLEKIGVITKLTKGVENASPVVWIKKPNGSLRMCVDYKVHVNERLKNESYPVPSTETIFAGLKNAKKFAKIDLTSAYWQIELDDQAKDISNINTSQGLFQVNRLQMGMKNSSAIFQRAMEQILADIKGILIYQDDVLVFAENEVALQKRLHAVKTRLREKRITINEEKSIELCDEITFLGFRVSARGIEPDKGLVQKIISMKPPTSRQEVECFVGLVNYFGRLISNISAKLKPINELRKKDVAFIWSKSCNDAFDSLKKELANSPVVQPYSLEKEATLTTDASQGALAGVLTQEGHPVIYISRSLSVAERKYSNIEREALAITWAVTRLKHFLLGRSFTIVTDHQPLESLFCEKRSIPDSTSPRIRKWALMLMNFDYQIQFVNGRNIAHADALSRLQFSQNELDPEEIRTATSLAINNVHFMAPLLSASLVRNELLRDNMLQRILWRVTSGDWTACTQAEAPFRAVSDKLTIENGMLYYGTCVFIPQRLRMKAFEICHSDAHSGIHSSYQIMRSSSWWPGMFKDIERYVSTCSICLQTRPNSQKSVFKWPSVLPFERLHIDWAYTKEVGEVLVIVDAGSGWIEAFWCKDRSTKSVVNCLEAVFTRFGPAKTIVSDNAKEFTSEDLNQWIEAHGARKIESPPYFPRSNGPAERGVQTIKRFMKCWSQSQQHREFNSYLRKVLFHHRISSKATGISPAEIVYGRKITIPIVSNYEQGQKVFYKATTSTPSINAEFVMTKGQNTAWLMKTVNDPNGEESCQMFLASNNQISPAEGKDIAISPESFQEVQNVSPQSVNLEEPKPELRRSMRLAEKARREDFKINVEPRRSLRLAEKARREDVT